MEAVNIKMETSWREALQSEFKKEYFDHLVHSIKSEIQSGKILFPPGKLIFNAFEKTPLDNVKVVILGQDPYHGPKQAMGLSFSVPKEVRVPPSLKNIYKELYTDLDIEIANHGDLTSWAEQGVFLLNAILTVEKGKAGSHRKLGWEEFTDAVIQTISNTKEHIVFMLWGNFAKSKSNLINRRKHLVLEAAHPSPLARGAYFGSKHFSQCNEYLRSQNKTEIDWKLS